MDIRERLQSITIFGHSERRRGKQPKYVTLNTTRRTASPPESGRMTYVEFVHPSFLVVEMRNSLSLFLVRGWTKQRCAMAFELIILDTAPDTVSYL
jgi:hypothetical protein